MGCGSWMRRKNTGPKMYEKGYKGKRREGKKKKRKNMKIHTN
jgi:hypothetical protein